MFILILAVLLYVSIFVVFKFFAKFKVGNQSAIDINYFIASITGYLAFGGFSNFSRIINSEWLIFAFIISILFVLVFNLFAVCTQKISVTMTAMSSRMSVIVPVFVLLIIFQEQLSILKIIGLILTLASLYLILKPSKKIKIEKSYIIIPLLIFFGSGLSDTLFGYSKKIFEINSPQDSALFVSTIFAFCFIIGLLILPFRIKKGVNLFNSQDIIGGSILGIINFLAVYCFAYAQNFFEASVFFPIFNVGVVAISAIVGRVFFYEKLSLLNYIGLSIAIISIFIMNI